MKTRLFSVNGKRDVSLCEAHAASLTAQGATLGVPCRAGAIMFGLAPWPTGSEPCPFCVKAHAHARQAKERRAEQSIRRTEGGQL